MQDLQQHQGRDLVFCGMVKTSRDGVDQWRNKPYLLAQLEDYSDTFNIRLKGEDYVNFKHYFAPDVALLLRATVNVWSPREEPQKKIFSLKLKSINLLADVRDKLVQSVNLVIDLQHINGELIDRLEGYTVGEKGKTLKLQIRDQESNMKVDLFARKKQVLLNDEFITFLREEENLEFKLA